MITLEAKSPVITAEERAWNYWFDDGLSTLVAGVGCLSLAIYLVYTRHHPIGLIGTVAVLALLLVYATVILRQRQIVEWLKAKITYPRTGYAAPPHFADDSTLPLDFTSLSLQGADAKDLEDVERVHKDRKRRAILVGVLAIGATALSALVESPWICLFVGAALGAIFWLVWRKDQRFSWLVLVGFPFVGFYMTIFPVPRRDRIGFFLLGAGILFVLEGAVTMVNYLRKHPMVKVPQA